MGLACVRQRRYEILTVTHRERLDSHMLQMDYIFGLYEHIFVVYLLWTRHSIGVKGVGSVISALQELTVYKGMEQRRLFQKRISTRTRVSRTNTDTKHCLGNTDWWGVLREEVN